VASVEDASAGDEESELEESVGEEESVGVEESFGDESVEVASVEPVSAPLASPPASAAPPESPTVASRPASVMPHALSHVAHCTAALSTADSQPDDGVQARASTPSGQPHLKASSHAVFTAAICAAHEVVRHEAHAAARTPPFGQFVIEKPPSPASPSLAASKSKPLSMPPGEMGVFEVHA
jgi:hypothetical protein